LIFPPVRPIETFANFSSSSNDSATIVALVQSTIDSSTPSTTTTAISGHARRAMTKEMVGGCCVCSDERGWQENPLVYCDGKNCSVAVHQGDIF